MSVIHNADFVSRLSFYRYARHRTALYRIMLPYFCRLPGTVPLQNEYLRLAAPITVLYHTVHINICLDMCSE